MRRESNLFIISSVAGGGKSTLISLLLDRHPNIVFSVSDTTRPIRPGDIPGVTYNFKTTEEFLAGIESSEYLEWALVHGNYYGTSKSFIESSLNSSKTVILDIDVQGAKIVKSKLPESKTIFIVPPSEEIWISRLKGRGTDSPESIEKRIANGKRELLEQDWFEYRIINDSIEESYQMLESIVCK
jgi:guanylate kinase